MCEVIRPGVGGLRSGMGYCGARDIGELQRKARFMRVSSAGPAREPRSRRDHHQGSAQLQGGVVGSADHRFSWSANPNATGPSDVEGVTGGTPPRTAGWSRLPRRGLSARVGSPLRNVIHPCGRRATFGTPTYRSPPVFNSKPVDRAGASTLILGRNLLRAVNNHNVAETFLRNQLQTELILDGVLKARAGISLRHGRSAIWRLPDHASRA